MARLLIVSLVYRPDRVSTASIVTRLAQELHDRGHDVDVLTSFPHYNPPPGVRNDERYRPSLRRPFRVVDEDGTRVIRCFVPQKPDRVLRRALDFVILHAVMSVAALREARRPDVILVISPPLTLALVAMLVRRFKGGKLVYNVQELWPDLPRQLGILKDGPLLRAVGAVESRIYRSSECVTAIGDNFAAAVVARGGHPDRTRVIPNFVDTTWISPSKKENPLSVEWGLAATPVVLYAGNIGLTQDFDTLLEAARALEADATHVLIVGDGAARSALEARLEKLAPPNVTLRNFVPDEAVSDLYALADVHIIPLKPGHDQSTTPSKVFSAMAAGRPIVACTAPGSDLGRTVLEADAGQVVPPANAGQLVSAIRAMLARRASGDWQPDTALGVARAHAPAEIADRYDRLLCDLVRPADADPTPAGAKWRWRRARPEPAGRHSSAGDHQEDLA